MIKNFKCDETEKIYKRTISVKLPVEIHRPAMRKLWMLDAAVNISDLRVPPANHLEKLIGNRKGGYSIRINNKWRICFCWHNGNAYDVEIVDYH